jgi:hypothetical protein
MLNPSQPRAYLVRIPGEVSSTAIDFRHKEMVRSLDMQNRNFRSLNLSRVQAQAYHALQKGSREYCVCLYGVGSLVVWLPNNTL